MDDEDFNLIFGIVDELWKSVSKKISENASDAKEINFITKCDLGAVCRLLKLANPRIDPGDSIVQSHIFQDPPARSERIVFTTHVDDEEVNKSANKCAKLAKARKRR